MMTRTYNFNAGPSALPLEVLEKAQSELVNFNNTGMSVMELSHRSKEYEAVHEGAKQLLKDLYGIPDDYDVLFLQGGASLQFSMIPMNFLTEGKTGYYALTGSWSEKALKEAKKVGKTAIAASSKEDNYRTIPNVEDLTLGDDAAYLHLTSNNTIFGTQWQQYPELSGVPLIADMSSDILSRQIKVDRFSLIYAGAQKNLGPSGVTVVIVKKDLLQTIQAENLPSLLDYRIHADKGSLYNTPPTFAIYMLNLVLQWVDGKGGIAAVEKTNDEKSSMLYDIIDKSDGFYTPHAARNSRSAMNVTFTLPTEERTAQFLKEAKNAGFSGLNGHRSIGGCRASIYNAVPIESVHALARFMKEFKKKN